MISVKDLRQTLQERKGERNQIQKTISNTKERIRLLKKDLHRHEKALEIIKEVGLKTQQQLQYQISDITSLALDAVFDNPYELVVKFLERRNKAECDLSFNRDDNRIHPLNSSGYGAVDVASFALRIASWSMQRPRSKATIIMDEPFKNLSKDLQPRASEMIKEISDKLGIQFIIVTHDQSLSESADRTFEVYIKKGISQISKT